MVYSVLSKGFDSPLTKSLQVHSRWPTPWVYILATAWQQAILPVNAVLYSSTTWVVLFYHSHTKSCQCIDLSTHRQIVIGITVLLNVVTSPVHKKVHAKPTQPLICQSTYSATYAAIPGAKWARFHSN